MTACAGSALQTEAPETGEAAGRLTVSDDATPSEWDGFVRARHDATAYHLWAWRDVFERGLGHACRYLAARQNGQIVGVLPLVEMRSRIFGRALSSLPYVNYGGVLAATHDAGQALVDAAARLATSRSLSYVLLRHRRRMFPTLQARTHKVTMVLPLGADRDTMWHALDKKVRNQIRKAEKSGLTVTAGGDELLDDFYAVFARNMRDLGTPVYGRSLFASILSHFPRDAGIHLVRLHDKTIAGAMWCAFGHTIEVPSASSLRTHRALCPNHVLYWSLICAAIAQGRTRFDFGRSTPNDGTYHFKEQWGATPEQLWWEYCLTPGAAVPTDDRQSPKFRMSISAWKRLPVAMAIRLGPHIARAVP